MVGTVDKPNVTFDHGVNVGGYLVKGLVFGAAIGALAGGITAAMEEKFFPGKLPGYEPKPELPSDPVQPAPLRSLRRRPATPAKP